MDRILKNDTLTAIVIEITERTGVEVHYWAPDDDERNPEQEHIFGVVKIEPIKIKGIDQQLIWSGEPLKFKCGHTHHNVNLNDTWLSIGECLTVDLNDPTSIDRLVEFYTPIPRQ